MFVYLRRLVLASGLFLPVFWAQAASASDIWRFSIPSIDGGDIDLSSYEGRPVLIVNTASLCAFTPQLGGLQDLWERYRDDGLVVLAVPSDDFRQELEDDAAVKDFCSVTFGLDMPMSVISGVRGTQAHPLYRWLDARGATPAWNFHKVLISREGEVAGQWPSPVAPLSPAITRAVEAAIGG